MSLAFPEWLEVYLGTKSWIVGRANTKLRKQYDQVISQKTYSVLVDKYIAQGGLPDHSSMKPVDVARDLRLAANRLEIGFPGFAPKLIQMLREHADKIARSSK